jgi:hypothetical protein
MMTETELKLITASLSFIREDVNITYINSSQCLAVIVLYGFDKVGGGFLTPRPEAGFSR